MDGVEDRRDAASVAAAFVRLTSVYDDFVSGSASAGIIGVDRALGVLAAFRIESMRMRWRSRRRARCRQELDDTVERMDRCSSRCLDGGGVPIRREIDG